MDCDRQTSAGRDRPAGGWTALDAGAGHPVRQWPDLVLRHPAVAVTDSELPLIRALAQRMTALVDDAHAWGLAAPQVGVSKRLFVFYDGAQVTAAVNPVLGLSGNVKTGVEGCLSFGQLLVDVPRATHAQLTATDLHGEPFTLDLAGILARVAQHETDHLDGRLIIDFAAPAAFAGLTQHPQLSWQAPAPLLPRPARAPETVSAAQVARWRQSHAGCRRA